MNLPKGKSSESGRKRESSNSPESDSRAETYLTVDGEAWDVSNLLNSLPSEERKTRYKSTSGGGAGTGTGTGHGHGQEETKDSLRKLPPSAKKAHTETLQLKPVPKYEWRARSPSPPRPPPPPPPAPVPEQPQVVSNDEYSYGNQGSDDFERSLIEVFPGVEMPLRGSFETQQAISRNYLTRASCMDCTLELQCIRDAEYILCPLCHCVSPLELSSTIVMSNAFGVGLGFCEDI